MIYMFLSNNPSSGDINLLNLSCGELNLDGKQHGIMEIQLCIKSSILRSFHKQHPQSYMSACLET